MGKATREANRARRREREAEFGVFCPGMLDVLSIGHGDVKLTLDTGDPEDVERARQLIEEMMRKGYGIFVDTDDGPTKVHEFNPRRMSYMILETPGNELASAPAPKALAAGPAVRADEVIPPKRAKRGRKLREVPVAGSRATAVGRTSGG